MLGLSHLSNNDICTYGGISKWVELGGRTNPVRTYKREGKGGCIVVIRDITKERELEEKTHQSEKLALIGQMTAAIAHEIKNPLTAVIGYSEILMHKTVDDSTKSVLDRVYSSALRVERIVNDLLAFSRRPKLNREKTNLNKLIDEAIDKVNEALSIHRILQ
jgi:two-component system sporulation sensor kinase A